VSLLSESCPRFREGVLSERATTVEGEERTEVTEVGEEGTGVTEVSRLIRGATEVSCLICADGVSRTESWIGDEEMARGLASRPVLRPAEDIERADSGRLLVTVEREGVKSESKNAPDWRRVWSCWDRVWSR
jgi:hypothetical protein